jgi:hypothetical protein
MVGLFDTIIEIYISDNTIIPYNHTMTNEACTTSKSHHPPVVDTHHQRFFKPGT